MFDHFEWIGHTSLVELILRDAKVEGYGKLKEKAQHREECSCWTFRPAAGRQITSTVLNNLEMKNIAFIIN